MQVEALLRVSEHIILDNPQSEIAKAERERLRSDLNAYVRGLCTGLPAGSRSVEVRSKVASLSVARVNSRQSQLYLPALKSETQDFAQDIAYVRNYIK
jgi:hypothetical protein